MATVWAQMMMMKMKDEEEKGRLYLVFHTVSEQLTTSFPFPPHNTPSWAQIMEGVENRYPSHPSHCTLLSLMLCQSDDWLVMGEETRCCGSKWPLA